MNDWNTKIIKEFRENEGVVGGPFEGSTLLLLHTHGAKSKDKHTTPLMYRDQGDDLAVFASRGGSTRHPDWYYNILEDQDVTIEVGTETFSAKAQVAEGDERDTIWSKQKVDYPTFAEYEVRAAPRKIPVIVLSKKDALQGS